MKETENIIILISVITPGEKNCVSVFFGEKFCYKEEETVNAKRQSLT